MRITYLRAAFDRGFILAGEAIRCVSRIVCVNAGLDPKALGRRVLVAFVFLFLLLPTAVRATTYIDPPQIVWWGNGTSSATYLPDANAACAANWVGGYMSDPYPIVGLTTMPVLYDPSVSGYPGHAWALCCTADFPCTTTVGSATSHFPREVVYTVPVCPAGWEAVTLPNALGQYIIAKCQPVASCPVLPLTQPPFSDACSTSLEQGKGVDVNNKCDPLSEDMRRAANCIADKINKLSSPPVKPKYTTPSATVRTAEYQDHLLEIWTKSQRLSTIMNSVVYTLETKQACAATYAAVSKEKAEHGIKHQPSSSGEAAPHVERRAIDVPEAYSDALMDQVTLYTTTYTIINGQKMPTRTIDSDVEDYIHSATVNPPACDSNISWGGRFDPSDWVHFQLP